MWWSLLVACATPEPEPPPAAAPAPTVPIPPARATRTGTPDREEARLTIEQITVSPESPTAADDLRVTAQVSGSDARGVVLAFQWSLDGAPVMGAISDTFQAGRARRGQKVKVEVTATAGELSATKSSDHKVIANRPPVMRTNPGTLTRLDGVQFLAEDPDGEGITWRLEGAPAGMSIERNGVLRYKGTADEKGGTYTLKVIAEDPGRDYVVLEVPVTLTPGSAAAAAAAAAEAASKK